MRLGLYLLLAALTAAPALAQTHLSDSTGVYLDLDEAFYGTADGFGGDAAPTHFGLETTVGYRFASGLDAGLRVGVERYGGGTQTLPDGSTVPFGAATTLRVGPVVGYTRALTARTGLRLEGGGLYERSGPDGDAASRTQVLSADLSASVYRTLTWKRLAFRPGLGVYAEARYLADLPDDLFVRFPELSDYARTRVGTGLQLSLPLSLRVLGHRSLTVDPFVRYGYGTWGTLDARGYLTPGLSLRFNF